MAKRTTAKSATPAPNDARASGKRTTAAAEPRTTAARKSVAAPNTARKPATAAPRTRTRRTRADDQSAVEIPDPVALPEQVDDVWRPPEPSFDDAPADVIDPDLRHRMISEAAYHHYVERGYEDGYDLDDWLQAESEIDRALANPAAG